MSEIKLKEIGASNELKKASITYKIQAIDKKLLNQLVIEGSYIKYYDKLFISENILFRIVESLIVI